LSTLKTAVFAPSPRASVTITIAENFFAAHSDRDAYARSRVRFSTGRSSRQAFGLFDGS
jgi:hypothetical protein